MVILERRMPGSEVAFIPRKENTTIVTLERQIHERRQEIKGLITRLNMLGMLRENVLIDDQSFLTQRGSVVDRMLELNMQQHLDRKELGPHKRAKETKKKSPFKHILSVNIPTESRSSVRTVSSRTKHEVTIPMRKPTSVALYERTKPKKSNNASDPLTLRVTEIQAQLKSLWIQKQNGEIIPKEYRRQQQALASQIHEAERQRGTQTH